MRFTERMVNIGAFRSYPMVVVDGGARRGARKRWNIYKSHAAILGFEPEELECARLVARAPDNHFYYPIALSNEVGEREWYRLTNVGSSGFYPPNPAMVDRFPWEQTMHIVRERTVPTTTLDVFMENSKYVGIDFIKLDVEGAELDALKGASNQLDSFVLGVHVEALFTPVRYGQSDFCMVDTYLRDKGFRLYDLAPFRHLRRTVTKDDSASDTGQVVYAVSTYFRDILIDQNPSFELDVTKVLKLASLFELFNLKDCAIEVLSYYVNTVGPIPGVNFKKVTDLLR